MGLTFQLLLDNSLISLTIEGEQEIIRETSHKLYQVLDLPTKPWEYDSNNANTQLTWTEVLDKSCEWAKGTINVDQAARRITETVNGDIGLKYEKSDGRNMFNSASTFNCSNFLIEIKF